MVRQPRPLILHRQRPGIPKLEPIGVSTTNQKSMCQLPIWTVMRMIHQSHLRRPGTVLLRLPGVSDEVKVTHQSLHLARDETVRHPCQKFVRYDLNWMNQSVSMENPVKGVKSRSPSPIRLSQPPKSSHYWT